MSEGVNDSSFDSDVALLMQYPEVAAAVPDPRRTVTDVDSPKLLSVSEHAHGINGDNEVIDGIKCWSWWTHEEAYSFLGALRYQWHHHVAWCREWNLKITQVWDVWDKTDHMDGGEELKEVRGHTGAVGSYHDWQWRQRHIVMSIPIKGHVGDCYPENTMHFGALDHYWVTDADGC